ncbi:MAG: glycosyltransferase family 4 protein [Candidatus Contendobacter sp.]|nr:glycosyltransferase family 4 protein [Candidatus Contendobacter sp.]MDG4557568.1 glycosyltransferase family 4 protein [Candidatus Contendobacter sp.]
MAFAVTFFLSRRLACAAVLPGLLDYPNARSLHQRPIPRTGGLAMLAGMIVGMSPAMLATADPPLRAFGFVLAGLAPLAFVSLVDDRQGVAAGWRILVHLLAAVSLLAAGFLPDRFELPGLTLPFPVWIAIPLTLLFIVWMINLYNFMDGMDGFAGGMAVIGFATLAWLGRADAGFTALCLTAAAASGGFLVQNFPPAKIFLGDTGSTALGFLAAVCGLWGSKAGLLPFWVALLVFSPFITDATVTLLRRLRRGEKIWEAHRAHCYQRLVLLGWGHRRTVLVEYALMLACAGSALLAVRLPPAGQVALLVGWVVAYGLLMGCVEWLERRHGTVAPPGQ